MERFNGRVDWKYAIMGGGALLVGMAGLKPTLVSSVIPLDMRSLVYISSQPIII